MTKRRFCGFFGLLPPFWFFFCYIKVTAHTHTSILVTKSQLNKWPKKYKLADMSMNVFGCFRVNWTRFSLCSFLVCVRQSVQSDDKLLFLFYRIFADLCAKVADALHDEKSTTFSFSLPHKIACCSSICTDMCSMLVHFFTFFSPAAEKRDRNAEFTKFHCRRTLPGCGWPTDVLYVSKEKFLLLLLWYNFNKIFIYICKGAKLGGRNMVKDGWSKRIKQR